MTRHADRAWANDRRCFVCGRPNLPDGHASYYSALGLLTCPGPCDAAVMALLRVYDRSPRGRFRPAREVRDLLRADRPPDIEYPERRT
jgi:hypothetical protein